MKKLLLSLLILLSITLTTSCFEKDVSGIYVFTLTPVPTNKAGKVYKSTIIQYTIYEKEGNLYPYQSKRVSGITGKIKLKTGNLILKDNNFTLIHQDTTKTKGIFTNDFTSFYLNNNVKFMFYKQE